MKAAGPCRLSCIVDACRKLVPGGSPDCNYRIKCTAWIRQGTIAKKERKVYNLRIQSGRLGPHFLSLYKLNAVDQMRDDPASANYLKTIWKETYYEDCINDRRK